LFDILAQYLQIVKGTVKFAIMKLWPTYQNLKNKSLELLAQGFIDDYFETLLVLSNLEKQFTQSSYLN